MEREYGADNFAAKIVGRGALIDVIDKELLYLNNFSQKDNLLRKERLELKKKHLLLSRNLPSGRNERIILEAFPSIYDRTNFISTIEEASRGSKTGTSK